MGDLTLFTYDWVPEAPRGYVRDLRVRWALGAGGGGIAVSLGKLSAHSACRDYMARGTARPAFVKAHADQLAHLAAGDARAS